MKKTLPLLLLVLVIQFPTFAQYNQKNWGFSLGASFPVGDFGSLDIKNESAGWARLGVNLNFFYEQQLTNSKLGLIGFLNTQINPTASQDIANEYWYAFPYYNWTVESGSWKRVSLMFGGFKNIKTSDEICFKPRILLGIMTANSPEITTSAIGNGEYIWVKQNNKISTAICYSAGISMNLKMTRESSFKIEVDCLGGKPNFKNVEMNSMKGERDTKTFSLSMTTINLNMGLVFEL